MNIQKIKDRIQKQDIAIKIFDKMDTVWNLLQEDTDDTQKTEQNKRECLKTIQEIESLLQKLKSIL